MSKTEVTVEMSEVEISHLQHLINVENKTYAEECFGPNASTQPTRVIVEDASGSRMIPPPVSTQVVDLSASTDEQSLTLGERTPACYGEVPAFVLAKVICEGSPSVPSAKSRTYPHIGFRSKVCLDKRFCTMSPETIRQPDDPSPRCSNWLTVFEQTSEAFEGAVHPHVQRFKATRRSHDVERVMCNPVANLWDHVISQASQVADSAHQRFACQSHPRRGAMQSHPSLSNAAEALHLPRKENSVPIPAAARSSVTTKKSLPRTSNERREKHNLKERQRRKKIRLYCDELNTLAPFCEPESDKVTTLKWTTAFLKYINKKYGDSFKEEFEKMVSGSEGQVSTLCSSFAQKQEKQKLTEEQ